MSFVRKKKVNRDFSGVQEGKRNYGFSSNVHGPSWFWSSCALRAQSSLVSSHASQTRCLTEKRALAVTSGGLEARSGCRWVSHMQGGLGVTPSSAFRIWIITTTFSNSLWFFTLFTNVVRCNWPAWPRADAMPQTWEVIEKTPKYTHIWMATELQKSRDGESTKRRSLHGNKQTWLLKYSH